MGIIKNIHNFFLKKNLFSLPTSTTLFNIWKRIKGDG